MQYKAEYLCHSRELQDTKGKKWGRDGKPTTQISPSEKLIERKVVPYSGYFSGGKIFVDAPICSDSW